MFATVRFQAKIWQFERRFALFTVKFITIFYLLPPPIFVP